MTMKRSLLAIVALILSLSLAVASDITVSASAEKKVITVGDPIHYTVTLTYPAGSKLTPPEKPVEIGQWSVADMKVASAQTKSGNTSQDITYSLIAFSTGAIVVPELAYSFTSSTGAVSNISTSSTTIPVESVLDKYGDQGDIRDIKPPLALINLWPFIILILVLAIAGIWFYLRQRRLAAAGGTTEPAVPARPPHEVALEELAQLENSGPVGEGRIKEYYSALSDIVRTYLGTVYNIETLDRTTSEIFSQLRGAVKELKITMPVRELFDNCDLVKFAKYRPEAAECSAELARARTIVNLIFESTGI